MTRDASVAIHLCDSRNLRGGRDIAPNPGDSVARYIPSANRWGAGYMIIGTLGPSGILGKCRLIERRPLRWEKKWIAPGDGAVPTAIDNDAAGSALYPCLYGRRSHSEKWIWIRPTWMGSRIREFHVRR